MHCDGVANDGQRQQALDQLPLPYATALRLRDAGIEPALIAQCVGVDEDGLPTLLRLAEKKLAATGYLGTA